MSYRIGVNDKMCSFVQEIYEDDGVLGRRITIGWQRGESMTFNSRAEAAFIMADIQQLTDQPLEIREPFFYERHSRNEHHQVASANLPES